MHLASFIGEPVLIKSLLKYGADFRISDKDGLTVMHYAAINNQPYPIVFFKEKYMSVNVQDNLQATPLHFAIA